MKISEADYIEWYGVKGMKWKNHIYATDDLYAKYKKLTEKDLLNNKTSKTTELKEAEKKFNALGLKASSSDKHSDTYTVNGKEYKVPKENDYRSKLSEDEEKEKVNQYMEKLVAADNKKAHDPMHPRISQDELESKARDYAKKLRESAAKKANTERKSVMNKIVKASEKGSGGSGKKGGGSGGKKGGGGSKGKGSGASSKSKANSAEAKKKAEAAKFKKQLDEITATFKKQGLKPIKQDKNSTTYMINGKKIVVPKKEGGERMATLITALTQALNAKSIKEEEKKQIIKATNSAAAYKKKQKKTKKVM